MGDAPRADRLHVGVSQLAQPDTFRQDVTQLVAGVGHPHVQALHAPREAIEVVLEREKPALPDVVTSYVASERKKPQSRMGILASAMGAN
jgi:hypothetical protein